MVATVMKENRQSTKSGRKDLVAVETATETATRMETTMVTMTTKTPTPTMVH